MLNIPVPHLFIAVHVEHRTFHLAWMTVIQGGMMAKCPDCQTVAGYTPTVSGAHEAVDVTLDDLRSLWVDWSAQLYAMLAGILVDGDTVSHGSIWSTTITDPREGNRGHPAWWIGICNAAFVVDAEELERVVAECQMYITKAERHGFASFDAQNEHAELPQNLRDELAHLDLESL